MTRATSLALLFLAHSAVVLAAGCSSVDCETLCEKTLACEIAFAPGDDPDEAKIISGERSELESCTLGCEESPTVTVESAGCIDTVAPSDDVDVCQPPIMNCLGLAEAVES
jgi:hypothetical protein